MAGSHRRRHTSCYSKHRRRRRHHPYKPRDQLIQYQLQQEENKQHSSGSSMDESKCDVFIPVPLPLLDIDVTSWLPFPELCEVWGWCSSRVAQSLDWMKDTIFPSRVYQRELQETKHQLILLHQQIEQLKAQTLQQIQSSKSTLACKCSCQNAGPIPSRSCTPPAIGGVQAGGTMAPQIPPLPPPPPPPPPPISQPPKALVFKKKATGAEQDSQADSGTQRPVVTLSDIMNVKLKKVNDQQAKQPPVDVMNQRAVVTLTDIRNIQLRKTFKDRKSLASDVCEAGRDDLRMVKLRHRPSLHRMNDENANKSKQVLRNRISQEAVELRGSLRRVSVVRSPGGTPLKGKPCESQGTGLTPLMTKALRRKFKTIRTPSPSTSPSFNTSSFTSTYNE